MKQYHALPKLDLERLKVVDFVQYFGSPVVRDLCKAIRAEKLKRLIREIKQEIKYFESLKNVEYFDVQRLRKACARFYDMEDGDTIIDGQFALAEKFFGNCKYVEIEPIDAVRLGGAFFWQDKLFMLVPESFDETKRYTNHELAILSRNKKIMVIGYSNCSKPIEELPNLSKEQLEYAYDDIPYMITFCGNQQYYKLLREEIKERFDADYAEIIKYYNKAKVLFMEYAYKSILFLQQNKDNSKYNKNLEKDIDYYRRVEKMF